LEVGVRWSPAWELVVRQSPASKYVNTETEEALALEAVTRHLISAVVNCRVCELELVL
jgi:hypothetical protein